MVSAIVTPMRCPAAPIDSGDDESRGFVVPWVRIDGVLQAPQHAPAALHVHALQDDHELVAAVADRKIVRAAVRADDGGDALQHDVADRVRERIVDRLEPVDVDQRDGHRHAALVARGGQGGDLRIEPAAIEEAGQRVLLRGDRQRLGALRQRLLVLGEDLHLLAVLRRLAHRLLEIDPQLRRARRVLPRRREPGFAHFVEALVHRKGGARVAVALVLRRQVRARVGEQRLGVAGLGDRNGVVQEAAGLAAVAPEVQPTELEQRLRLHTLLVEVAAERKGGGQGLLGFFDASTRRSIVPDWPSEWASS